MICDHFVLTINWLEGFFFFTWEKYGYISNFTSTKKLYLKKFYFYLSNLIWAKINENSLDFFKIE